ncbi:MAG: LacI family DNA-binding transcriptional regulator [Eubacteriales bacterium]|nr:LacI family DNA-binding transcriptional regulator [Eubacteriales bacterium]
MRKNITLKDIASELGVTAMTVSKALNNHPDISEARKKQILEMAEKMNYIPNALAKNLRTKSSSLIGVIVADNSNPYFANSIKGVERVLSLNNYHSIIFNSNEDPKRERMFINDLRSLNVAGIIMAPALGNKQNVEMLKGIHIPYVLFSRYIDEITDTYVIADDISAGYLATKYLLEKKGGKVVFINSNLDVSTARNRMLGYNKAFAESGLPIDSGLVFSGALYISDGYELTKKILKKISPPFSLLCYSDYIAIGALQALSEENIKIPQDVALMGIDNIEYSAFTNPKLSTVALPSMQIGISSANLLIKIIKSKTSLDIKSKQIILRPHLMIRDST